MGRSDAWALPVVSCRANVLEGDSSASALVLALYDSERIPLTRYLLFLGMDAETSRDLLQEAFLRLHQHLLADGDRSELRAWLYRVSHNLAQNRRRAASSSRTEPLDSTSNAWAAAAPEPSPEAALLRGERDHALTVAMQRLSQTRRECLVLRSAGFRYREIAGILDTSTSTVAEHVQKGIQQLRQELEQEGSRLK